MKIESPDVLIIGGGPAGLACAAELGRRGVRRILLVEREKTLGGVLRQCIHDGFGLLRFGESLAGPEYAARFIDDVERLQIPCMTGAMVTSLSPDKTVTVTAPDGLHTFRPRVVVLAMGCRERTRGALAIPGERPAGVFTAGVAQSYMNLYNKMPAREAVILGSGDIGLIMARRLTLEGAHVKGVYEILPYPSGLARNIEQCLHDYGIPLHLSHTVTAIHGDSRLTGVTVARVDENRRPIHGTEEEVSCDTLILSVGLIPENELTREAGALLSPRTQGPVTSEYGETSVPGVFAAGNVLAVHDLVDRVSEEAERTAEGVCRYLAGDLPQSGVVLEPGEGIGQATPGRFSGEEPFTLSFRVNRPFGRCRVVLEADGQVLTQKKLPRALPAEKIFLMVPPLEGVKPEACLLRVEEES